MRDFFIWTIILSWFYCPDCFKFVEHSFEKIHSSYDELLEFSHLWCINIGQKCCLVCVNCDLWSRIPHSPCHKRCSLSCILICLTHSFLLRKQCLYCLLYIRSLRLFVCKSRWFLEITNNISVLCAIFLYICSILLDDLLYDWSGCNVTSWYITRVHWSCSCLHRRFYWCRRSLCWQCRSLIEHLLQWRTHGWLWNWRRRCRRSFQNLCCKRSTSESEYAYGYSKQLFFHV